MAIIHNGRTGRSYLAAEVSIDKRLTPSGPFSRGDMLSWDLPEDDSWTQMWANVREELEKDGVVFPDWPPIDRTKIGWLCCTFRLFVGEQTIYQHGLLVQYTTFRDWFYMVRDLLATEHEQEEVLYSGFESPELRIELRRNPIDPDYLLEPSDKTVYGHSLHIYVDACVAEGGDVAGEGPGMFLYVNEEELVAFAQALLDEANEAG